MEHGKVTNSVVEEFVCGLVLEDQSNGSRIQLASNSTEVPKLERLRYLSLGSVTSIEGSGSTKLLSYRSRTRFCLMMRADERGVEVVGEVK